MSSSPQTIDVLKAAYRKHVLMDDSIGWDELGNSLSDVLCNEIGDAAFCLFLSEYSNTPELPEAGGL